MAIKVFDRIEKKYLLTNADKKKLLPAIKSHMQKDGYHKSQVLNLYFDDKDFSLISQSIDWTDFKYKLRARSYSGYDRVFLEIKTKLRAPDLNPGYKRRIMITRKDFDDLINNKTTASELAAKSNEASHDLQIAKEIDYLINRLDLSPKILITYRRESYADDDGLRITFDDKLKYRDQNLSFNKAKHDKMYFKGEQNIIMEVKAHEALPLWFTELLSERSLYPQRFSKIGKVYEKITKEKNV